MLVCRSSNKVLLTNPPASTWTITKQDRLGKGQMAVVYRERVDGRELAVKMVRESRLKEQAAQFLEMFDREARLLLSCQHENVVKAIAFDETQRALWMGLYFL